MTITSNYVIMSRVTNTLHTHRSPKEQDILDRELRKQQDRLTRDVYASREKIEDWIHGAVDAGWSESQVLDAVTVWSAQKERSDGVTDHLGIVQSALRECMEWKQNAHDLVGAVTREDVDQWVETARRAQRTDTSIARDLQEWIARPEVDPKLRDYLHAVLILLSPLVKFERMTTELAGNGGCSVRDVETWLSTGLKAGVANTKLVNQLQIWIDTNHFTEAVESSVVDIIKEQIGQITADPRRTRLQRGHPGYIIPIDRVAARGGFRDPGQKTQKRQAV